MVHPVEAPDMALAALHQAATQLDMEPMPLRTEIRRLFPSLAGLAEAVTFIKYLHRLLQRVRVRVEQF